MQRDILTFALLHRRDFHTIWLQTPSRKTKSADRGENDVNELALEEYEILEDFPFTSERKRMGIIVREKATGRITFYMKVTTTPTCFTYSKRQTNIYIYVTLWQDTYFVYVYFAMILTSLYCFVSNVPGSRCGDEQDSSLQVTNHGWMILRGYETMLSSVSLIVLGWLQSSML